MKRWKARWEARRNAWLRDLPVVERQAAIPRHVVQVLLSGDPGEHVRAALDKARRDNPNWTFDIVANDQIEDFIGRYYGAAVLARYRAIEPSYGAARVDLFRYLYIYRCGGVYLDIKSGFTAPLDDAIRGDEQFILSQWRNGPGDLHEGFGLHPDLADVPGGEFQIFHVIGAAGHPFLRAVIATVLANIDEYTPWRFSVGRIGVLRVTGPIAYTRAINPLLPDQSYKRVASENEICLAPSVHENRDLTRRPHYSSLRGPIVAPSGLRTISFLVFSGAFCLKKTLQARRQ